MRSHGQFLDQSRTKLSSRHKHISYRRLVLVLVRTVLVVSSYDAKARVSFSPEVLVLSHSQSWAHVGSEKDLGSCDRLLQMEPVTLSFDFEYATS